MKLGAEFRTLKFLSGAKLNFILVQLAEKFAVDFSFPRREVRFNSFKSVSTVHLFQNPFSFRNLTKQGWSDRLLHTINI